MKKIWKILMLSSLAAFCMAGCSGQNSDAEKIRSLYSPENTEGTVSAVFHTNMGDISVKLFPEYAPKAVENFTYHAKEGYYDNVIFHRVIEDFMIQGGDPLGTGTGGESIWGKPFKNETTPLLRHFRGALSMANAGPDTNGSQFFIVQAKEVDDYTKSYMKAQGETAYPKDVVKMYEEFGGYPSLDGGYSIFGYVTAGMDVVDKITALETDQADRPLTDVIINSITVTE